MINLILPVHVDFECKFKFPAFEALLTKNSLFLIVISHGSKSNPYLARNLYLVNTILSEYKKTEIENLYQQYLYQDGSQVYSSLP